MKYLMLREQDGGEFPFLFCSPYTHLEVGLMLQGHRAGRTLVSAGFVEFAAISPRMTGDNCGHTPAGQQAGTGNTPQIILRCFGRSESLNLDSRSSDSAHLTAFYQATLSSARALHGLPCTT